MKYALSDGQRHDAQPGLSGHCPACNQPMVSKCGEIKVWHWAHRGRRTCDSWWENETEWHRAWKNRFPADWQEAVAHDASGEKHIADVKTGRGWVIEFQHSYLNPEERRSRENFYLKLVWVVDATRRTRDHSQFLKALQDGRCIDEHSRIWSVFPDECTLIKEWSSSKAPVLFDFAKDNNSAGLALWLLIPAVVGSNAYVMPISSPDFVAHHHRTGSQTDEDFGDLVKALSQRISTFLQQVRARSQAQTLARIPISRARRQWRL